MRKLSPLASYNRVLATLPPDPARPKVETTNLGVLAAGEAHLLTDFVRWAEQDLGWLREEPAEAYEWPIKYNSLMVTL